MSEKRICRECYFWQHGLGQLGEGACKRNPPQILMTPHGYAAAVPNTKHDDWCGEWEAALAPEPELDS